MAGANCPPRPQLQASCTVERGFQGVGQIPFWVTVRPFEKVCRVHFPVCGDNGLETFKVVQQTNLLFTALVSRLLIGTKQSPGLACRLPSVVLREIHSLFRAGLGPNSSEPTSSRFLFCRCSRCVFCKRNEVMFEGHGPPWAAIV